MISPEGESQRLRPTTTSVVSARRCGISDTIWPPLGLNRNHSFCYGLGKMAIFFFTSLLFNAEGVDRRAYWILTRGAGWPQPLAGVAARLRPPGGILPWIYTYTYWNIYFLVVIDSPLTLALLNELYSHAVSFASNQNGSSMSSSRLYGVEKKHIRITRVKESNHSNYIWKILLIYEH